MPSLDTIIHDIDASPEKGKLFEKLCAYFLMHDRLQQSQFSDVHLWHDWPGNNGTHDTGIDIVASVRDSDSYCAVQCKFRQDDSAISKAEIDSFLALSSKSIYSARILFTLTGNFSDNARSALTGQNPPVRILTRQNLEESSIDWSAFSFDSPGNVRYKKNEFRQYQEDAVNAVLDGLVNHDRGKLIMACGTGKTLVSLRAAEKYSGRGGLVLVLVPSISLLNQSVTAWNYDHDERIPLISLPVCSDTTAGYDSEDMKPEDLTFTPDTDPASLARRFRNAEGRHSSLTAVFSTYQSLGVIHDAQELGLPDFDLVICDEAHRTAGAEQKDSRESLFRLIHKPGYIHARKRLYMTATPKIFGESAKSKAKENYAPLYSMDDEETYGPEFFRFSFSDAIDAEQLSDYKVIVFTYFFDPEDKTVRRIDDKHGYTPSDTAKIIGIRKALAKELYPADYDSMKDDLQPMRSAVVFTNTINASETFTRAFSIVTQEADSLFTAKVDCSTQHIDGSDSASTRAKALASLHSVPEGSCRIISNARCLSEGVDVPALDAIVFLSPKRSEVDIVQSAGRVMRKAPGKKFGYVIIPVAVRPGKPPHEQLDNNEEWSSVWRVLKAMRSHDNTFQSAVINELRFSGKSEKVIVVPPVGDDPEILSRQLAISFTEWEKAITAKIVEKCGDREYWDKWTRDLADIAAEIERRIREALTHHDAKTAFSLFMSSLHASINKHLTDDDAVDMLTQHMITEQVFNAFFGDFSRLNPVSQAMNEMISALKPYKVGERLAELQSFYSHVYATAKQAATSEQKYEFMHRLYEDFFRTALKRTADKLGIVYTPNEIVDFILNSTDWALRELLSFTDGFSSPDVRVLDPFSGTGKFTAKLISSGLISDAALGDKYEAKIFANEILPLAYYISAVNIESAFLERDKGRAKYFPFPGISLTDTFAQDNVTQREIFPVMLENSLRVFVQSEQPVNVIIGNPPYSVGQKSANDNNQNTVYPALRASVKSSYAAKSSATNKNSLYDSYILAFRWAADRLRSSPRGVVCFVTNASFLDSNSADGMRLSLAQEFQHIFVFNLRGNQRAANWREEGEKVFGEGSQCPVAITLLVKDDTRKGCEIWYYEVGDGMKRDEKLAELVRHESFGAMIEAGKMRLITPNVHGDWITQRGGLYDSFVNLGCKKENRPAVFGVRYSRGVVTGRDAWCYNFSREALCANMAGMIGVYNSERERWNSDPRAGGKVADYVTNDPHKISWDSNLERHFMRNTTGQFRNEDVRVSLYRPYVKENTYFSGAMNERVYQMPQIFPETDTENLVICVPGIGSKKPFSVLMTDCIPEVQMMMNGQCFPLYWYTREPEGGLFGGGLVRHDGIGDEFLADFRERYGDDGITKRDVFMYIYGVLSSREYAVRFGDDAKKVLARIPLVSDAGLFREFVRIGRALGVLHVNYEGADMWPVELDGYASDLRVKEMKILTRSKEDKRPVGIKYNDGLTIRGIPDSAWEYEVNGKSALRWIAERYCDDVDDKSGLRNDCNAWGRESGKPGYVMELIRRVITVSVRTAEILGNVPELGV